MEEIDLNIQSEQKPEILTLRIPSRLKQNIINIKNRLHSKLSRISQNYLRHIRLHFRNDQIYISTCG